MRQAAIDKSQNASKGAELPAVEEEAYEGREVHGEGEEEEMEVDDDFEMKAGDSTKMQSMITGHHIKFNQGSMPFFFQKPFLHFRNFQRHQKKENAHEIFLEHSRTYLDRQKIWNESRVESSSLFVGGGMLAAKHLSRAPLNIFLEHLSDSYQLGEYIKM